MSKRVVSNVGEGGMILHLSPPPRGHLAMAGDFFVVTTRGQGGGGGGLLELSGLKTWRPLTFAKVGKTMVCKIKHFTNEETEGKEV